MDRERMHRLVGTGMSEAADPDWDRVREAAEKLGKNLGGFRMAIAKKRGGFILQQLAQRIVRFPGLVQHFDPRAADLLLQAVRSMRDTARKLDSKEAGST